MAQCPKWDEHYPNDSIRCERRKGHSGECGNRENLLKPLLKKRGAKKRGAKPATTKTGFGAWKKGMGGRSIPRTETRGGWSRKALFASLYKDPGRTKKQAKKIVEQYFAGEISEDFGNRRDL